MQKQTEQTQTEQTQVEKQFIILSKEDLDTIMKEAAEVGARVALDRLAEEKKNMHKKAADRRLHNTRLLLRNYRMLKSNTENSVYGRSQMEESAADVLCSMMNLYDDEVIVDAIKRSSTRTAIMVTHIDTMLEMYNVYCDKSPDQLDRRRYEVLYDRYITEEPLSVNQIAKKQHMSKDSVYTDIKIAVERLSTLLFGVDGLHAQ